MHRSGHLWRGAARSKSTSEALTLEGLAEDVIGVMDNLNIGKAVITGHSIGGPMACTIAAVHPDRVAGIVCIGPVYPPQVKPEFFTKRIETVMKGSSDPSHGFCPMHSLLKCLYRWHGALGKCNPNIRNEREEHSAPARDHS